MNKKDSHIQTESKGLTLHGHHQVNIFNLFILWTHNFVKNIVMFYVYTIQGQQMFSIKLNCWVKTFEICMNQCIKLKLAPKPVLCCISS